MRVLIACERSGNVRRAFRAIGHEAFSCDLHPADDNGPHILCVNDLHLADIVYQQPWDLLISHPPCTYLSSSGLHWNKRRPGRAELTEQVLAFVAMLLNANAPAERKALENPIGCISTRFRKPSQIIQPHQFGHDASKATCLWLDNLPLLIPTRHIAPRIIAGKPRWANQTDSGQNRLGPSDLRSTLRAETYQGIADAFALQWGKGPFLL